jgi:hypothetical protein
MGISASMDGDSSKLSGAAGGEFDDPAPALAGGVGDPDVQEGFDGRHHFSIVVARRSSSGMLACAHQS